MHAYRSHTCAALSAANAGEEVRLSGWVHRVRDHGGVLFIDLRDHYGITQILCDGDSPAFAALEKVRAEWVIRIDGKVKLRDASLINAKIPTGEIEVYAREVEVLGPVEGDLPVQVFGEPEYPEETRLTYRFLDLRRDSLHQNMMLRSNVVRSLRNRMWDRGFTEFQTPIITASSPEGARDFLVPSRLHPGKFYALPQAPQQFKQLIMVAGFDRYFQIAPCFRDEDPRADRSPTDFYQLDIEMSFVKQEDVFAAVQPVIQGLFEEFGKGKKVDPNWPLIAYRDALKWYGSDKPDLRNPIKMADVSEHFKDSGFAIFAKLLENEGTEVRAIPAPTGGSRKFCDRMNAFAQANGLPGMGYIFWRSAEDGSMEAAGPIAKALGAERTEAIRTQLNLAEGDAVFFLGGKAEQFESVAGKARNEIGRELGLTETDTFRFAWIVDFPMYEKTDEGKIDFSHNPFSMPQGGLEALMGDPLKVYAYQYDLACNGYELVSGGIRNHRPDIMFKAFELAGYPKEEVEKRFGGMVKAFRYGAPPHGGCAAGIDRIVMLLADTANIREVIMFPMNQRAEDLMMGAPSEPMNEQLRELRLRVLPKDA
ncbi:aspartate--tRNA ligase [Rhodobacter capsulatus]|uniref:Aspartate--tRNA(Asp/Asn) ligase n=1 Tax=Rhodobacter capsulatus (strain ATCC BAA-309 / NBRC 16581 / SB1003) TaxID=272942 RepID=D5AN08_RHOCB|nr:aspartate--tRNA ligase [Rhodobacter capsulatus]ADE84297.1 aspartyl-tRNA synthetase [Rhodobacter capsulatus SB 1003]ETD03029.1 aspartyl-tRNA synthetase [Rhodobacter capsulatus DE442]ETD79658.1 aspartyl-tRNA synthetase [Rhodobacter capsulatus R121]ETE55088.1 aspartyl-tRNA synthetase [Rhodobacter capsulatus Y262]MDS0925981.1 aspartate--tRNA ligase [Rhodobacter capsulatus]